MRKLLKNAYLLIVLLLIASGAAFAILLWGFDHVTQDSTILFYYGSGYLILIVLTKEVNKRFPSPFTKVLMLIVTAPLAIIMGLGNLMHPISVLIIYLMFFLGLSVVVPSLLVQINEIVPFYPINSETKLFVILTGTSIISLGLFQPISSLSFKLFAFTYNRSERMEKYQFPDLINYIFNKTHLRFLIYLGFCAYLLFYSIDTLEGENLLYSRRADLAVLQSFLCFLAFDRVVSNKGLVVIESMHLLSKLWTSVIGVDNEENNAT